MRGKVRRFTEAGPCVEPPSLIKVGVESAVLLITAEETMLNRTRDSEGARQIVVAQATVSTARNSKRSLHRGPLFAS